MNHPPTLPSPPSLSTPIDLIKQQTARTGTFLGALIKTSPFVPIVAVLLSIATYVATGAFTSLKLIRKPVI